MVMTQRRHSLQGQQASLASMFMPHFSWVRKKKVRRQVKGLLGQTHKKCPVAGSTIEAECDRFKATKGRTISGK